MKTHLTLKQYKLAIQKLMYENNWGFEAIGQVDEEDFNEYWLDKFGEGSAPEKALEDYRMECIESGP